MAAAAAAAAGEGTLRTKTGCWRADAAGASTVTLLSCRDKALELWGLCYAIARCTVQNKPIITGYKAKPAIKSPYQSPLIALKSKNWSDIK